MRSVGDAYDNAMAESFFSTLRCELAHRSYFHTTAAAQKAVFEYIEGWYNTRRRHSSLGYQAPITYKKAHRAAARKPKPLIIHRTGPSPRNLVLTAK
jgi:putative transposase